MLLNLIRSLVVRQLGMDRAIAASSLTQLVRFVTGPVTMVLIIRYLSPQEQGFFYSFAGVVGIQVFLEAGFTQSITQFASREFASLRFNHRDLLTGKSAALSRLRSIFHKANRYYTATAALLALGLSAGGYFFFSTKPDHDVPWLVPWLIVSVCAGLNFLLSPFWAILEGCNRVAEVATYRFWITIIGFVVSAIGLKLGCGIYVTALTATVTLIFPIAYLWVRWGGLLRQMLRPAGASQVSWGREIWAFQWRTGIAWVGGYLLSTGITPVAFSLFGASVAGKVGMAVQITRIGCGFATAWTATKIPYLGILHAKGKRGDFEREWKSGASRHIAVATCYQIIAFVGIIVLPVVWPKISTRFLSPLDSIGFFIGTALASVILIHAHYCRACRIERFMWVNFGMAFVMLAGAHLLSPYMGPASIGASFAFAHLLAAFSSRRIWKQSLTRLWDTCEVA